MNSTNLVSKVVRCILEKKIFLCAIVTRELAFRELVGNFISKPREIAQIKMWNVNLLRNMQHVILFSCIYQNAFPKICRKIFLKSLRHWSFLVKFPIFSEELFSRTPAESWFSMISFSLLSYNTGWPISAIFFRKNLIHA